MNTKLEIKLISTDFATELSDLLTSEVSDYLKHFIPFEFDQVTITSVLKNSIKDKFFGLFVNNKLVGFYMLRGFDQGYAVPSYGVYISHKFSGLGLAKLTLHHALSICRINKIEELMLKVHPDNIFAKKMYEDFGFNCTGKDKKNDNLIYKIKIGNLVSK